MNNIDIEQEEIDRVWSEEWTHQQGALDNDAARTLFRHRLFLEGYPVFKKYIPENARELLEVGGGSGRYGLKFAQDFTSLHVLETDVVEESLTVAKKLSNDLGLTNVSFGREDATALSFPDESFDIVFCEGVIQHLPNAVAAVAEMRRVLRPGGLLVISAVNTWNFHSLHKLVLRLLGKTYRYGYEHSYTKEEFERLFRMHQLEVVAHDGFYPAYGIYRLKYGGTRLATAYEFLGKACNRLTAFGDMYTNRWFSRHFGFMRVCVGRKK